MRNAHHVLVLLRCFRMLINRRLKCSDTSWMEFISNSDSSSVSIGLGFRFRNSSFGSSGERRQAIKFIFESGVPFLKTSSGNPFVSIHVTYCDTDDETRAIGFSSNGMSCSIWCCDKDEHELDLDTCDCDWWGLYGGEIEGAGDAKVDVSKHGELCTFRIPSALVLNHVKSFIFIFY